MKYFEFYTTYPFVTSCQYKCYYLSVSQLYSLKLYSWYVFGISTAAYLGMRSFWHIPCWSIYLHCSPEYFSLHFIFVDASCYISYYKFYTRHPLVITNNREVTTRCPHKFIHVNIAVKAISSKRSYLRL